jgi:leader peptidase (prepilin peptidase)/N-methyltransferase
VRYVVGEVAVAALWVGVWLRYGWSVETVLGWVWVSGLWVGAVIDLEHYILPDRITLGGVAAGLAASWCWPQIQGTGPEAAPWVGLAWSAASAALGAGLLWGVAVAGRAAFKRDAMGMGDVKLLAAVGACLGWRAVLFTVLASSLSGTLTGLGLMAAGKRELTGRIPYGPHLALGAVLWMFAGRECVAWYWGLAAGGAP